MQQYLAIDGDYNAINQIYNVMTVQQIQYLVALNRHRHFSNAADECGVSQPTLSAMIQKLEDELDVKIFDRSKHPIEPTPIGEKIIRQAERTLNEMNRIAEIVTDETSSLNGSLKLGIIPTIAPYIVPRFIGLFTRKNPTVTLTINEMTTANIIKNLEQGNLDMAILATPLEHPSILEIPLYYEHFVAYIGEDNPLLDNDIFPADPPEEGMWVLQEGHCLRNQVANYCHMKNNANHIYEAGAIDTLVRIVDCNGGFTLIPELHVQFLSESQRSRTRTLANPPAVREVSIVVREDYVKERMLNAVADVIKMIVPSELIDERMKRFAIRLK